MVIMLMAIGVMGIIALEIIALANGINGGALAAAIGGITAIITGGTVYPMAKKKGYKIGKEEFSQPPVSYEE